MDSSKEDLKSLGRKQKITSRRLDNIQRKLDAYQREPDGVFDWFWRLIGRM